MEGNVEVKLDTHRTSTKMPYLIEATYEYLLPPCLFQARLIWHRSAALPPGPVLIGSTLIYWKVLPQYGGKSPG